MTTGDEPGIRDVVVVGGGPAGAAVAVRLARAGLDVLVLERSLAWRWRAGGVFASPVAVDELEGLGLPASTIEAVARRIPAMRLETAGGVIVRLTYGADAGGDPPVGFDRAALDPALLALAQTEGATVRRGVTVTDIRRSDGGTVLTAQGLGGHATVRARVVVGADGPGSVVARAAGVSRPVRLPPRLGLSWHQADVRGDGPLEARLQVIHDGYVGIAPVPGGRVNVGIVLGPAWRPALASDGAARVAASALAGLRPAPDDDLSWRNGPPCDRIAGASPLGARVTRRGGTGWFLVGDAAGFLDPFTGEGVHRALVSARLAAPAIVAAVRGRATPGTAGAAYDRAMRRRFATKDGVSWLVQTFLAHPALFEYAARRLATRDGPRATMGLVMGDLVPASRGLDPRFLAAVLLP